MANLPLQTMPFIGRGDEIVAIAQRLADPACRLLTLVGPGGMGKTRLAIEVANYIELTQPPVDGIFFVDLQSVNSSDLFVTAIANSLNILISGTDDPRQQLLSYLSGRNKLLLLDNFEQLLDSVDLLAEILRNAPDIKLLVTSREALNIQEEWVWHVGGLQVPEHQPESTIESYSAVQLFVERARRTRKDFLLTGQETHITRTCQLVEGMPLALELAASWTKALTCNEIANEIQRGFDFLTTNKRNVLDRHQSMQVVFDHSWRLLTEYERQAFPRLAVFRGGFQREAAEQVADASLAVLAGLVDKSFLRVNSDGRYQIHELIRQYAEERLDTVPDAKNGIQLRHCTYFADFLYQRQTALRGPGQAAALDEIEAELDNIRVSWEWAVEHDGTAQIHKAMHSLYLFCHIRAQAVEGQRLFDLAFDRFQHQDSAIWPYIYLVRVSLCWFNGRNFDFDQFPRAVRLAYQYWTDDEIAVPLRMYYYIRPELETSGLFDIKQYKQLCEDFRDRFISHNHPWGATYMLFCLGGIAESLDKQLDVAEKYYRQCMTEFLQIGDSWGTAWASMGLGWVCEGSKSYPEALQWWRLHQDAVTEVGDRGGIVYALACKARVALHMQDNNAARRYVTEAIKSHLELGSQFAQLDAVFRSLIALFVNEGQYERAAELTSFLWQHAETLHAPGIRDAANESLVSLAQKLPPERYQQAIERGKKLHLQTILEQLGEELSEYSPSLAQTSQLDSLTERELEVLRLTAAGHSNRQIANNLVLTLNTVKSHIHHIYGKLGVVSRTQAVARARELQLL